VRTINAKRSVAIVESPGLLDGLSRLFDLKSNTSICIIRSCGGLGDVLMITPGLRALKDLYPEAVLTVAVDRHSTGDDQYYGILKNAPFIDYLIDARYVERKKYDKVIDISAVCISYERKVLPNINRIKLFASHMGITQIEDYLPFYKIKNTEVIWAEKIIAPYKEKGPLIALHSSSNDPKRNLPVKNQVDFIKSILTEVPNATIILFDFNRIFAGTDIVQQFSNSIYEASFTDVRQMAALIGQCDVFVGPDSGPMHLAGALSIPSVVTFGSIPPDARINYYPTHTGIRDTGLSCLGCWYEHCSIDFRCMKNILGPTLARAVLTKLRKCKLPIIDGD
jgi:ADP-heptose:LPS heptosyltransferase